MHHIAISAYFAGLTAVGFYVLWGQMLRSGAAESLGALRASARLSSGDPLRVHYTGFSKIDQSLVGPVIFYDILMYQQNIVHRYLLVSVFSTMQATSLGMLVRLRGSGKRTWWSIVEHAAWGVFSQAFGAAVSYPLYCLVEVQRHKNHHWPKTTQYHKREAAFILTSLLAALMPAWLLYPAFTSCSSGTRQFLIASYRASPIVLSMMEPLISKTLDRVSDAHGTASWHKTPLRVSAGIAAACHFYVILSSQYQNHGVLAAVFWPGATGEKSFHGDLLAQACHLFLQNDLIVIGLALVPYSVFILGGIHENGSWSLWLIAMLKLSLLSVLVSPGAVFAWTLASIP